MSCLRSYAGARCALLCLCLIGVLAGCAGSRTCSKPGVYARSTGGPPLRVPPDLSQPPEDASFEVPEGTATAAGSPPCGHYPPKIASADTAPPATAAKPSSASAASATQPPPSPAPAPAPTPGSARTAVPSASPELLGEVRQLVMAWAESWATGNFDQYLQYYAQDFDPPGELTLDEWREARRALIDKQPTLSVEADTLTVQPGASDGASVEFVQRTEVDGVASTLRKGLVLVREDGDWRIQKETVVAVLSNPR